MTKTLEAHDKRLVEIFSDSYQFVIPDYQRPYSWTTEQAGELFDDLYSAMQDAPLDGTPGLYFLGSVVLIKNGHDPKSFVVDGQQRLTTLTILLAALRVALPEAADDITDFLYKKGKAVLGQKDEYRLTAREEDADFFRTHIQKPDGLAQLAVNTQALRDSRLRYRENASLLLEKVTALSTDERRRLLRFLLESCSLVVISTPNLEAAYRIFSVLNNRGLDLAPIDILKAQVLGLIRSTENEHTSHAYAKEWSSIESALGRDAFGDLFGHIRTIYAKQKQRGTLVREFQEHVSAYKTPIILIEQVIKPYAEVWDFVRNANFSATQHAEAINEYLYWLNRVDFKDWVPPALAYFKRFRQQPDALLAFFKSLERLTYCLLLTKVGIHNRLDIYAALLKQIEPADFTGDASELTVLNLSDKQKRQFLDALSGDVYEDLPRARMALVLRLESLMRAPGLQLQDALSLEHVLPQTPADDSEWLQWFPDLKEREYWTHRLANLVPLDRHKNSSARNFSFTKKKDAYFKGKKNTASPFVLTQEVRAESAWTPDVLAQRQARLLQKLTAHWALD